MILSDIIGSDIAAHGVAADERTALDVNEPFVQLVKQATTRFFKAILEPFQPLPDIGQAREGFTVQRCGHVARLFREPLFDGPVAAAQKAIALILGAEIQLLKLLKAMLFIGSARSPQPEAGDETEHPPEGLEVNPPDLFARAAGGPAREDVPIDALLLLDVMQRAVADSSSFEAVCQLMSFTPDGRQTLMKYLASTSEPEGKGKPESSD